MSFLGKRVLVTGGARGLGRAIVEKFVSAGAIVVAMDKNAEELLRLKSDFPAVSTVEIDLLDYDAVQRAMEMLEPVDHLINNAGVLSIEPVMHITMEAVDLLFGVNFKAGLNLAQIFAKSVAAHDRKETTIVNVSSTCDRVCKPGTLVYSCSKAAVTMMTKCLAKELAPIGIRVNAICPTIMRTWMVESYMDAIPEFATLTDEAVKQSPIPRYLETHEAAELVLFLASPAAGMITGAGVVIDGGFTL